jgi:hypothetical protein
MHVGRFKIRLGYSLIGALAAIGMFPSGARAQDSHGAPMAMEHHEQTPEQRAQEGAFVKKVREATARFRDPRVAMAEGYAVQFGCVSGSDQGAMGVHLVNGALIDGVLNVNTPELLVYEPTPGGGLRLVAADYLVMADVWKANNPAPPQLMGQLFHLFDFPNRFGLDAFYTLHVWAWKENPAARSRTGTPTCRATPTIRQASELSSGETIVSRAIRRREHRLALLSPSGTFARS